MAKSRRARRAAHDKKVSKAKAATSKDVETRPSPPPPPRKRKRTTPTTFPQYLSLPAELRLLIIEHHLASIPIEKTATWATLRLYRSPLLRVSFQMREEVLKLYPERLGAAIQHQGVLHDRLELIHDSTEPQTDEEFRAWEDVWSEMMHASELKFELGWELDLLREMVMEMEEWEEKREEVEEKRAREEVLKLEAAGWEKEAKGWVAFFQGMGRWVWTALGYLRRKMELD